MTKMAKETNNFFPNFESLTTTTTTSAHESSTKVSIDALKVSKFPEFKINKRRRTFPYHVPELPVEGSTLVPIRLDLSPSTTPPPELPSTVVEEAKKSDFITARLELETLNPQPPRLSLWEKLLDKSTFKMVIGECAMLSEGTTMDFEQSYKRLENPRVTFTNSSRVVKWNELFSRLKYLVIGITTDYFPFNDEKQQFLPANLLRIRGYSSASVAGVLDTFLVIGSNIRHLEAKRRYFESSCFGKTGQAFAQSLDSLLGYFRECASRQLEEFYHHLESQHQPDHPGLFRLKQTFEPFRKFLDWLVQLSDLFRPNDDELINVLYVNICKVHQHGDDPFKLAVISAIFEACSLPLSSWLNNWLNAESSANGQDLDPFNEFFIQLSPSLECCLEGEKMPIFLSPSLCSDLMEAFRMKLMLLQYRIPTSYAYKPICISLTPEALPSGIELNNTKFFQSSNQLMDRVKELLTVNELSLVPLEIVLNERLEQQLGNNVRVLARTFRRFLFDHCLLSSHLNRLFDYALMGDARFVDNFRRLLPLFPAKLVKSLQDLLVLEEKEDYLTFHAPPVTTSTPVPIGFANEGIWLSYKAPAPLHLIMTEKIMQGYNRLFGFLQLLLRTELILYQHYNASIMEKAQFINALKCHAHQNVISPIWTFFLNALKQGVWTLEEVKRLHELAVETMLERTFLTNPKIMRIILDALMINREEKLEFIQKVQELVDWLSLPSNLGASASTGAGSKGSGGRVEEYWQKKVGSVRANEQLWLRLQANSGW